MGRSNWTPSIVPNENDRTVYLVAEDFGKSGRAWTEADYETTDLGASPAVPKHIGLMALGEAADRVAALAPIHPEPPSACSHQPAVVRSDPPVHANVFFGASPKELFHHGSD